MGLSTAKRMGISPKRMRSYPIEMGILMAWICHWMLDYGKPISQPYQLLTAWRVSKTVFPMSQSFQNAFPDSSAGHRPQVRCARGVDGGKLWTIGTPKWRYKSGESCNAFGVPTIKMWVRVMTVRAFYWHYNPTGGRCPPELSLLGVPFSGGFCWENQLRGQSVDGGSFTSSFTGGCSQVHMC